jgi:OOP family OmpA-OmpF porin
MGSADVRVLLNVAYVGLGKPPKPPPPAGPPDRDLDKIPDDVDACPDEAGPPSPNPKLNGCPAHDRDGDGIRDEDDACPDTPGIPYPDPKANGCPDSDNDGLPDPIDQCVNEPGPPPTGCPKHARLAEGGFKIDPPIDFGTADKLRPEARAALEEVAATLRANPKIQQISISIGTKGAKPPLSDKRAQEVLSVLRAGNLDPNRYEVVLRDDVKAGQVQVRIVK